MSKEQEVLMNIADIAIWIYQAESALLRVEKLIEKQGEAAAAIPISIVKTYFYDVAELIDKAAKDAIYSFTEGDEARMMVTGVRRFTKLEPINPKNERQAIAQYLIDKNAYTL